MSPEAIQSLIEMFGVEQGVQILNLFTAPEDTQGMLPQKEVVKNRPKELYRETSLTSDITQD